MLNTFPSLEARVSALERRQYILEARVEELSKGTQTSMEHSYDDMNASFQQPANYQIKTEQQIETRFNLIDSRLDNIETRLDKQETLLTQILARLPQNPQ